MNIVTAFRKYEDNPGFDDPNNHGDLWKAIHICHIRIAVVDERLRVAITFVVPGLIAANGLLLAILLGA